MNARIALVLCMAAIVLCNLALLIAATRNARAARANLERLRRDDALEAR